FIFEQAAYGPSLALNWLLFDIGGRSGAIDEAKAGLIAANLAQNAAIQDTILHVEQAYYTYQSDKELLVAARASTAEAERAFDSANARRKEGVATIADVLQAQTAWSQAKLALQQAQAQEAIARGTLANALGLAPSVPLQIGEMPEN